ncbi:lipopolysaccharide biosynthesis protein [Enterococcus lemanii]|uniref:Lipopolysaccharide biosynthesis protein n=1 Tax=Enterococcus lemanii TaxID=1159752 RepID=A0ABV9MW06_9ENTE|nr:oligosaccharide flippase family protein [Enterococcus lemanii]MBM7709269.1 O-antigen/teichoic acid export membrane protein [Enterococcus lemanii]
MNNRIKATAINSSVSTIIYLFKMILQFIIRTVFIYKLGKEYLGLNGLFTSILSMLSLAELGIGNAIVYSLYSPLARQEYDKVNSLMRLYKKIYLGVAGVVAIIGIGLLPFLNIIIGTETKVEKVHLIFILFLLNSVCSYMFTYNRSLLNADQKNYIPILNDFYFQVGLTIIQIVTLYFTNSYILFLIFQILATLFGNIRLSKKVNKSYKFLNNNNVVGLSDKTKEELKKNTLGNIATRISSVIVVSSDNILISSFVSLSSLGIYSNYSLITTNIVNLVTQIVSSVTSSIGNLGIENNYKKTYEIFKKHNFINFTFTYFASTLLLAIIQPFINLWAGESFLLSNTIVLLIIIKLAIDMYRKSALVFLSALGLSWYVRWKAIAEIIVNISVSVYLLIYMKLGLVGVLLSNIISSLTVVLWWELHVVFKYGFNKKIRYYIYTILNHFLSFFLSIFIISLFQRFYFRVDLIGFMINLIVGLFISLLIYLIFYYKKREFKFVINYVSNIIRMIFFRLRR